MSEKTTREGEDMPLIATDWELQPSGALRPVYTEVKVGSEEKDEGYEGVYPRYRYELVDQNTGEVVESATKRRKSDRKVKSIVDALEPAELSHLGYYELCQEETEGPWVATLLAEGRMLLRVEKLKVGHKGEKADRGDVGDDVFVWNDEEHMWELTEDQQLALIYAGYGTWD